MRPVLGRLHRWVGLAMAGFLFVSGLTGALIAWTDELDSYLNPHLKAASGEAQFTATELARKVEEQDRRIRITYLLLQPKPGGTVSMFVQRSEEHTSELQSLMRISYAVFCLKKK